MHCPILTELPPPPPGKTGWPWTEESPQLPDTMPDGCPWPRVSIVTPSYNQGQFIDEAISSVLRQGYPNLEYIVVDGGSADGSVDVIRKYTNQLASWISEPDQGQYDAINKGFACSSGEIMAWLNADDKYFPWTLWIVAEIFTQHPEVEWFTSVSCAFWDIHGRAVNCLMGEGFNCESFFRGRNAGLSEFHSHFIMQESTFWRRTLWESAGSYVDARLQMAGDFELWARFWQRAVLYSTTALLAGFRVHNDQKTAKRMDLYRQEVREVLKSYGVRLPTWSEIQVRKLFRRLPGVRRYFGWEAAFVAFDYDSQCWFTTTRRFV